MNEIIISNTSLPIIGGCDQLTASEPFFHTDRIAPFHVLIYVTDGIIYVTEDENDYEISAGELLFLKSGVRHYGKIEVPRGTSWYYVHFALEEPEGLESFRPDSAPIPQYQNIQNSLMLPKKLIGLSGGTTEQELKELVDYFNSEDKFKKWNINLRLFSLLSHIGLREFTRDAKPRLSDKICEYLTEHCCEQFSAAKLEQKFYLSYKHLAAVFKKDTGVTMQQYHTALRINQAAKLLRSTLLSIGEIADKVGYSDMLYFSRCFHKEMGMSPTEYRKKPPIY